jgi:SAM-dependent methyltransferase
MAHKLDPFHLAALRMLRELPEYRRLTYLELGCGDGLLMEALHTDGAKVRGTTYREKDEDYIRYRPYPEFLQVDGGIDLNKPLPYPDASFDVVYSTEVIEHIEGHRNFVVESARVLKAGGYLLMTTPNLNRLRSRLSYFLSGIHGRKQDLIPWTTDIRTMEEWHHRCVDFPHLHWLLWRSGLRIEAIAPTQVYRSTRILGLLSPMLRYFTRTMAMHRATPEAEDQQARRDLVEWLMSPALLTSEQFCLKAKKMGS